MYKFVALTETQVADGFRLGGAEAVPVGTVEEARRELTQLLEREDVGIIAFDERFDRAIDERLQRKIDSIYRPVVVMLPLREELDIEDFMKDRLRTMIRKAVGFDVTLKREAGS